MVDAIKNRLSFARKKFDNFQSDALETMEVAVFAACIVLGVLLVTPPLEAALGTFFTNTVASVQTPAAPTPGTGEILVPGAEGDVDKGVTQVEYQKLLSKVDEVNQEAAATKAALATTNNELAAQKEAWASICHVVEEGTTGMWNWRKWSNGTAECWGKYRCPENFYLSELWGSLYSSTTFVTFPDYPIAFVDTPTSSIDYVDADPGYKGTGLVVRNISEITKTNPGWAWIVRPTQSTIGHPSFDVRAAGRWK
ncbi:MAG: hypothetical protein RRX88_04675 [Raoultibacter sp.]